MQSKKFTEDINEELKKESSSSSEDSQSSGALTNEERSSSSFGLDEDEKRNARLFLDSGNEPDSDETWIQWYCRQRGHEMLVEID